MNGEGARRFEAETKSYGHSTQAQRRRALCTVVVDGNDITRAIDPHLISVQTIARIGDMNQADTASIELDDRDGRLAIPPPDAPIEISLGWQNESLGLVWTGKVQDIESGFSRRGGARRLWIEARGIDNYALQTAHFRCAWGDGRTEKIPLERVLKEAGSAAGVSVRIAPSMANISREYWAQNESFLHFGWRLAHELGGNFKVEGDVATMVNATDGENVDGVEMPAITAEWGVNLISWRIKPFSAAPQAGKATTVYFDREKGEWQQITKEIEGELPFDVTRAQISLPAPAANRVTAEQWNMGMYEGALANRGLGTIVINGEPAARYGGKVQLKGARAGIDGIYTIDEVEHVYSRSAGFITTLTTKFPNLGWGPLGPEWGWVVRKREELPEELPSRWGVNF